MSEAVQRFEAQRRLLESIAYRMLGSLAEAQDVVQETHLRWLAADRDQIRDARAWLVTVCTRLATNALGSARARRELYVGTWLPEPLLGTQADTTAAEALQLGEEISVALLVVLETLSPLERAAFLLHDVFGYDFEHIAEVLHRSVVTCRKLASRGRDAVSAGRPRFRASPDEHRAVVESFLHAMRAGDATALEQLLAADARVCADGGGKVSAASPRSGRGAVADLFRGLFALFARRGVGVTVELCWPNGALGVAVYEDAELSSVLSFTVEEGVISEIYAQRNPEKLGNLGRLESVVLAKRSS